MITSIRRACLPLLAGAALMSQGARADGLPGAPAPFDKGGVPVALITLISDGDFFQAYQTGAQRQAKALGISLRVLQGRGDPAAERDAVQQGRGLRGTLSHTLRYPEIVRDGSGVRCFLRESRRRIVF